MTRRCCSSWPGRASARASGWRSLATIQEKTSVAAATEPTPAARRAAGRRRFGARGGEGAADDGRRQQRADHVGAAALVLPRARRAVLVAADGDVLGAVVLGEGGPAQGRDRRTEREHCGDGLLRERREPRPADGLDGDHAPGHRPDDAGPLEGKLRLGQRRRTSGRSAKISATRAGPRASRLRTSTERNGLSPPATFSSPLSVRTAHDQCRGPCTRTPFARAMPPSLTDCSSLTVPE